MATAFKLLPTIGVDPILFGMSSADVERILAAPINTARTTLGEYEEQRDGINIRYSSDSSSVMEASLLPSVELLYHGVDLLSHNDPIGELLKYHQQPFEWVGFVIFLDIGVALTGYHDNDVSQRAITVSEIGRWDAYKEDFSLFRR